MSTSPPLASYTRSWIWATGAHRIPPSRICPCDNNEIHVPMLEKAFLWINKRYQKLSCISIVRKICTESYNKWKQVLKKWILFYLLNYYEGNKWILYGKTTNCFFCFNVDKPIYCDMQVQVQEKFYYYHCFEFVFKLILIRGSCTKCYEIPSKLLMQNRKKYWGHNRNFDFLNIFKKFRKLRPGIVSIRYPVIRIREKLYKSEWVTNTDPSLPWQSPRH